MNPKIRRATVESFKMKVGEKRLFFCILSWYRPDEEFSSVSQKGALLTVLPSWGQNPAPTSGLDDRYMAPGWPARNQVISTNTAARRWWRRARLMAGKRQQTIWLMNIYVPKPAVILLASHLAYQSYTHSVVPQSSGLAFGVNKTWGLGTLSAFEAVWKTMGYGGKMKVCQIWWIGLKLPQPGVFAREQQDDSHFTRL